MTGEFFKNIKMRNRKATLRRIRDNRLIIRRLR